MSNSDWSGSLSTLSTSPLIALATLDQSDHLHLLLKRRLRYAPYTARIIRTIVRIQFGYSSDIFKHLNSPKTGTIGGQNMVRAPKQERSKATVDAILRATAICVADKGLNGTSTRHIAKVAGVGVGSIYEYFEDKEAIFEALYESFMAESVALIQNMIPELTKMSTNEALRNLLINFKAFLCQDDDLYLKLIQQSSGFETKVNSEPVHKVLTDFLIQYMMQNPEVSRAKNIPALSYILINGGIHTVVNHISDPNPPITFEELADTFGAIIGHYGARELKDEN